MTCTTALKAQCNCKSSSDESNTDYEIIRYKNQEENQINLNKTVKY